MSILGRIVRLDVGEVGATAATAVASLLPSSGFWPASPNVSHCQGCFKNQNQVNENNNENEGDKNSTAKDQCGSSVQTRSRNLFPRPIAREPETGSHLASICFTVPVIWFIFSSKREMASLFCLELASELCRGNVTFKIQNQTLRPSVNKRWRYPLN